MRVTAPLLFHALPIPALALAAACSDLGPNTACAAVRSISIEVNVIDSVTGLPRADSATGGVQSGSYIDSLRPFGTSTSVLFAGDRLGTFSVTLSRPGYATWSRNGIAVTQKGSCGNVIPVQLDARLQPGP